MKVFIFFSIDIDECSSSNGGCQHTCANTDGSFYCSCQTGYELEPDRKSCKDKDECGTANGDCEHICNNKNGKHTCTCYKGYKLKADSKSCQGRF